MGDPVVGQKASSEIVDDLMDFDHDLPVILLMEGKGFHVRINFPPLFLPVGAQFIGSVDEAAFKRSRPRDVWGHQSQRGRDVPRVECRIGGVEQINGCR